MSWSKRLILLFALCGAGCGKQSTATLIENLKAPDALTRLKAVRTLPGRLGEAAQVVPALIGALKDADGDVRSSAAYGLGAFHEQARDALPALEASLSDREPNVRKAAGIARSFIDPEKYPSPSKSRPAQGK